MPDSAFRGESLRMCFFHHNLILEKTFPRVPALAARGIFAHLLVALAYERRGIEMTETNTLCDKVAEIIGPTVLDLGYELYLVQILSHPQKTLQLMIERQDGENIDVDDCATVSRAVSVLLDVEDPIQGNYMLEVSSPGLDRPLTKKRDFERFVGDVAKVETVRPLSGKRKFFGAILEVDESGIVLDVDGDKLQIPLEDIKSAKLSLDEQLEKLGVLPQDKQGNKRK